MIPIIAIVGRPNTGKSTLFNALIGERRSVTAEEPGTTRDRVYEQTEIRDYPVMLVDTGGLEIGEKRDLEHEIQLQAALAIQEAHIILFLVDAKHPPTREDFLAAKLLRKSDKPIIFIANKSEGKSPELFAHEWYRFGLKEPIAVSAIHKRGFGELFDMIQNLLKTIGVKKEKRKNEKGVTKICFIGRPNTGKSSLVNALLEKKQVIVSDIAGTTRDSLRIPFAWNDKKFLLIDTAGLRRRGRIERGIEKFSVLRGLSSLDMADIAFLVMDASEPSVKQDLHIASYVLEARKGLVLILNKCDLIPKFETRKGLIRYIEHRFDFLPYVPLVLTSAVTGENIFKLLEVAEEIRITQQKKLSEKDLRLFQEHLAMQRDFRCQIAQIGSSPPKFRVLVRAPLHFSERRFFENEFRKFFGGFIGTVISLDFVPTGRGMLRGGRHYGTSKSRHR